MKEERNQFFLKKNSKELIRVARFNKLQDSQLNLKFWYLKEQTYIKKFSLLIWKSKRSGCPTSLQIMHIDTSTSRRLK